MQRNIAVRLFRRLRNEFFPPPHPFDESKGVDTAGVIHLRRVRIDSPNRKFGLPYQGIDPQAFANALNDVPRDLSDYTFVDLGCGKGRALILAAEFGFRRIVGVEFSKHLVDVAQANLAKVGLHHVEIHWMDAADYKFPEGPLCVFLFNPFGAVVLRKVLDNLRTHSGPICLVYYNPVHEQDIEQANFLLPVKNGRPHAIWLR